LWHRQTMAGDEETKTGGNAELAETSTGEGERKEEAKKKEGSKDKRVVGEAELSEEDQALKDGLELAVQRLKESDTSLHEQALNYLCNEIRTSTASMTSVPKPLKMLRLFYTDLKSIYASWHVAHSLKQLMADMLSVLAITMAEPGSQECLRFKLEGTNTEISSWGHQYVQSLSGEISEEYNRRMVQSDNASEMDDLLALVDDILPFLMHHNAEAEAIDLLLEVQQLRKLIEMNVVDERNFQRVCLYLVKCADYLSDPEDIREIFDTAYDLYKQQGKFPDALRIALKCDDSFKLEDLFNDEAISDVDKKQMAFILGRHRSNFESQDSELNELIGNSRLSEYYLQVCKDMDIYEAKSPEDIYKTHLTEGNILNTRSRNAPSAPVDSARANLASTFVNGFVNAGFCHDKLLTVENSQWIYKNKDHGMLSAAASLGLVLMWNIESGLNEIDKYFHNTENYIKAGGCLAIGIVSSGVRNDSDPAIALLSEYLESSPHIVKTAAICGLGIAYASARRTEVQELLVPIVSNTEDSNIIEVSLAALSLGMVFVGTCDDEIAGVLIQRLMEASEEELNNTVSRYLCLGLGLLYLGKTEQVEAIIEAVRTIEHRMGKYAEITLETCAYAGTGNVLMIQKMLHLCAEHPVEEPPPPPAQPGAPNPPPPPAQDFSAYQHQAVAVIGISLMTVGEDIGTEMSLRTFDHLLHYGGLPVKRVVPLALGLLYVSNPDYSVVDQLSRLSHDGDAHVAQSAIFALGIVSAGSNNSRIAGLLRQLSEFYVKEANHLFVVRIAQGLNAMGKGLLTLNAFHSDRYFPFRLPPPLD
jgi:26S proteasome regulatory subunit N1